MALHFLMKGEFGLNEAMGKIPNGITVKVKMASASTGFHVLHLWP